jgi:phosphoribosyl-AMP cyclohydrolase
METTALKFNDQGLIPVVVQDEKTKQVLMVAYMNEESLRLTLETGKCTYFSRSRNKLWLKGETSGHFQLVKKILYDCDADTLLIFIKQEGGRVSHGRDVLFLSGINVVATTQVDQMSF